MYPSPIRQNTGTQNMGPPQQQNNVRMGVPVNGHLNTTDHPLNDWFGIVTVFSYLNVLMVLFSLPFAFGQGLNFLEMRFLTLPAFLPIAFIVASRMGIATVDTFSKQTRNGVKPGGLAMLLTALLGLGFIASGGLYFGYKTDYCDKEKDSYICAFFNDPFMEMIFAGALVIIFLAFAWKAYTTIFKGFGKKANQLRNTMRRGKTMGRRMRGGAMGMQPGQSTVPRVQGFVVPQPPVVQGRMVPQGPQYPSKQNPQYESKQAKKKAQRERRAARARAGLPKGSYDV